MYNKRDKIRKVSKQLLRFWVALSGVCPKTYLNSGIKQRKVINLTTFHLSIYSLWLDFYPGFEIAAFRTLLTHMALDWKSSRKLQ